MYCSNRQKSRNSFRRGRLCTVVVLSNQFVYLFQNNNIVH